MAEPAVADAGLRQEGDRLPDEPAAVDPAHRADSLWRLFETAHARTQALIVDYAERAAAKGAAARRLQIAALSLSVFGVLAPGLASLMGDLRDGWPIGYALLALAGGLALYDQVFGASRSWMRQRRAQARLEAQAVSLRYAWAARLANSGGAMSDAATVKDLADLILAHVTAVEALTEAEAEAWDEPFRSRLAAFDQTPKSTESAAQAPPRA
jgi:hypothetical protein